MVTVEHQGQLRHGKGINDPRGIIQPAQLSETKLSPGRNIPSSGLCIRTGISDSRGLDSVEGDTACPNSNLIPKLSAPPDASTDGFLFTGYVDPMGH